MIVFNYRKLCRKLVRIVSSNLWCMLDKCLLKIQKRRRSSSTYMAVILVDAFSCNDGMVARWHISTSVWTRLLASANILISILSELFIVQFNRIKSEGFGTQHLLIGTLSKNNPFADGVQHHESSISITGVGAVSNSTITYLLVTYWLGFTPSLGPKIQQACTITQTDWNKKSNIITEHQQSCFNPTMCNRLFDTDLIDMYMHLPLHVTCCKKIIAKTF